MIEKVLYFVGLCVSLMFIGAAIIVGADRRKP